MGQEKKYCPECGHELSMETKFCSECGYSFVEKAEAKDSQQVDRQDQPVVHRREQQSTSTASTAKTSKMPLALFGGLVVLLAVGAYFFFFNSELHGTWVATHGSDTYNMEVSRDGSVEWVIDSAGAVEIEMHFDTEYNDSTEVHEMNDIHYVAVSGPTAEIRDIDYEEFTVAGFEYEESGGRTRFYTENVTSDVMEYFFYGFPSISFERVDDRIIGYADGDPLEFYQE